MRGIERRGAALALRVAVREAGGPLAVAQQAVATVKAQAAALAELRKAHGHALHELFAVQQRVLSRLQARYSARLATLRSATMRRARRLERSRFSPASCCVTRVTRFRSDQ